MSQKLLFNPLWLKLNGLPVGLEFKSSVDRVYKNNDGYGFYSINDALVKQFKTFQEAFWYAYNNS